MLTDETKAKHKRKVDLIVNAMESYEITLNEWETSFIESLFERVSSGKEITMGQSLALNRIYARIDK